MLKIPFWNSKKAVTKIVAILAAAVIVLAALSGGLYYLYLQPPPRKEIVIGTLNGITGTAAEFVADQMWALEWVINMANKEGGVFVKDLGRKLPIRLIEYDHQDNIELVKSLTEKLITVDNVDAIVGTGNAVQAGAASEICERHGVPYISNVFLPDDVIAKGLKWTVFVFPPMKDIGSIVWAFYDTLPADKRPTKVAAVYENAYPGIAQGQGFVVGAQARGVEVVLSEAFDSGAADYTSLILKVKEKNPDWLFQFWFAPSAAVYEPLITQDVRLKLIVTGGHSEEHSFVERYGAKYVNGTLVASFWSPDLTYPLVGLLASEFFKSRGYKAVAPVGTWAAAGQVLVDAIGRAGTLGKTKLMEAIKATDMMTVMGQMKFKADGSPITKPIMMQWQNGDLALVWPPEAATANLTYPIVPFSQR
jgi:branched-chain amino acid transport system substrate-binding protein